MTYGRKTLCGNLDFKMYFIVDSLRTIRFHTFYNLIDQVFASGTEFQLTITPIIKLHSKDFKCSLYINNFSILFAM